MPDSITETIPREIAVAPSRPQTHAPARWIKRIAIVLVLLWIASEAISLGIQHTRLRNLLSARLQSAFGRPVEVGSYEFSLWDGFALEANGLRVGEDPRFGQEYFLRADSVAVRLSWSSLLHGRLEFGTLSLDRPSLNLVRNAEGDWNLINWLPQPGAHPADSVPIGPAFPSSPLRFRRIDIDGGRINFKNGEEKLPLAFVGVKGSVATDRPGRWRVNLEAIPWRAAVVLQQAGIVRLSGDLGGTSSRLRPAELDLSWSDASMSDVLRLATGDDAGIRGSLGLQISARTRTQDAGWDIQTHAQLQQVHRWNLPVRPDTPSLNFAASTDWNPATSEIDFSDLALEAPRSRAHATGRLLFNRVGSRADEKPFPVELRVMSMVDIADLIPWLHAFQPGVADGVSISGSADLQADVAGWPPRVVRASVSSPGARLSGPNLRRPARLGELRLRYDQGVVSLQPVAINLGAADGALQFDSGAKRGRTAGSSLHISANVSDVHDVLASASALGWNLAKGWDVSGPVRADLRWPEGQFPWQAPPVGSITWGAGPGSATLRVPFLNNPVVGINAVSQWKPGSRHIALASAEAFGAHWSGSFDRSEALPGWQFSLAGDHLAATDLDRWLNPAWRESFLDRVLLFLNPRSVAAAAPENLRAYGHLSLDQFTLAPLVVHKLQGDVRIEGRHIVFDQATGQFYGGQLAGSLDADLLAPPAYRAELEFRRIDAAALAAATPALAGFTAESAAGQMSIAATGANHASLISSLTCQGNARVTSAGLLNVNLWKQHGGGSSAAGLTRFSSANASFSCSRRRIEFQTLALLTGAGTSVSGTGTVDFGRNLDLNLRLHPSPTRDEEESATSFRLTGTLAAPKLASTPTRSRRSP